MTYDEISPLMRSFLGVFQTFRKIGFRSDDIYCLVTGSIELAGALGCYFHLKTQGKEFNIFLGPAEASTSDEYTRVTTAIAAKGLSPEDFERIYEESPVRKDLTLLLMMLMEKGFSIPNPDAS